MFHLYVEEDANYHRNIEEIAKRKYNYGKLDVSIAPHP
jgi:hypothetical protein